MEFHHLRHFIAVAEELHFRRAARRLGMSQPPLSQSIRRLEATLGFQLLERSRREVSLTAAGRVFLEESRRILDQVELAERLTKRAAANGVERLRVGFTSIAMFTMLPRVVQAFRSNRPRTEVLLEERQTFPQIEMLLAGKQDVGVLFKYGEGTEGLAMRLIERSPFVAAVPSGSPLAARKRIVLGDLARQPFVSYDPGLNPDAHAMFSTACRTAGFVPHIAQYANQTYTILSLVAASVGVALVGENARHVSLAGVTFVPVTGIPEDLHPKIVLAWASHANSPALHSFIGVFEEMLSAPDRGAAPGRVNGPRRKRQPAAA